MKNSFFFILFLLIQIQIIAQPGFLDKKFGKQGVVRFPINTNEHLFSSIESSNLDGKLLLMGTFSPLLDGTVTTTKLGKDGNVEFSYNTGNGYFEFEEDTLFNGIAIESPTNAVLVTQNFEGEFFIKKHEPLLNAQILENINFSDSIFNFYDKKLLSIDYFSQFDQGYLIAGSWSTLDIETFEEIHSYFVIKLNADLEIESEFSNGEFNYIELYGDEELLPLKLCHFKQSFYVAFSRTLIDIPEPETVVLSFLSDGLPNENFGIRGELILDKFISIDKFLNDSIGNFYIQEDSTIYSYLNNGLLNTEFAQNGVLTFPSIEVFDFIISPTNILYFAVKDKNYNPAIYSYFLDGTLNIDFGINGVYDFISDNIPILDDTSSYIYHLNADNSGNLYYLLFNQFSDYVCKLTDTGEKDITWGELGVFNDSKINFPAPVTPYFGKIDYSDNELFVSTSIKNSESQFYKLDYYGFIEDSLKFKLSEDKFYKTSSFSNNQLIFGGSEPIAQYDSNLKKLKTFNLKNQTNFFIDSIYSINPTKDKHFWIVCAANQGKLSIINADSAGEYTVLNIPPVLLELNKSLVFNELPNGNLLVGGTINNEFTLICFSALTGQLVTSFGKNGVWKKKVNSGKNELKDVKIDIINRQIYITGADYVSKDFLILATDLDGFDKLLWNKKSYLEIDGGGSELSEKILLDNNNSIYISGYDDWESSTKIIKLKNNIVDLLFATDGKIIFPNAKILDLKLIESGEAERLIVSVLEDNYREIQLYSFFTQRKSQSLIYTPLDEFYYYGEIIPNLKVSSTSGLSVTTQVNNESIASIKNNIFDVKKTGKLIVEIFQKGNISFLPSEIIFDTTEIISLNHSLIGFDSIPANIEKTFKINNQLVNVDSYLDYKWESPNKFVKIETHNNEAKITTFKLNDNSIKSIILRCSIYVNTVLDTVIQKEVKIFDSNIASRGLSVSLCDSVNSDCSDLFIKKVGINNIQQSSSCSPMAFYDYTEHKSVDTLVYAKNQKISITLGGISSNAAFIGIWLDFNNDGELGDAGEFLGSYKVDNELIHNLRLPTFDYSGPARLRIRASESAYSPQDYCVNDSLGETEDYLIILKKPDLLLIPELLSPNDDGANDFFVIVGQKDNLKNKLTIFDAIGVEIYSSNQYQNNWNGRNKNNLKLDSGTYFYWYENEEVNQKGSFEIKY